MAKQATEYVTIEVDGRPLTVRKDRYLLWSLRDAYYDVPFFCAHKWLDPPYAGCRQCMVKIEVGGRMMPKLQTCCSMLPQEGMKVFTTHPEVIQARKEQLEFHLLNHPLECPTCDKGGECMLQDQTMDHGLAVGRYIEEKRLRPDAVMNDFILMNYKRCIHCKRCIHYNEDIDGSHLLKFIERGASTWIESFPTPGEAPRFTGNVIDMCPVGALTGRNYRFMGRPWEQEPSASVGSLDSVGANIWLCARLQEMARIIPRDNEEVEDGLIDDVTRFSWECIDDPRRSQKPLLRAEAGEEQISPGRAYRELSEILSGIVGEHGPDSVGVVAGNNLHSEDYYALRRFAARDLNTTYYHFGDELFGAGGVNPAVLRSFASTKGTINQIVHASTVLSIGCDLFEEAPALGLRIDVRARRGQTKLLSLRSHRSDADRFAIFADYGYGNLLRTVRALANGLSGQGETLPELAGFIEQLKASSEDAAIVYGQEVWRSSNPAELVLALSALRDALAAATAKPVYLNPVYPGANSVGALFLNHLEHFGGALESGERPAVGSLHEVLQATADGKLKALLLLDCDPLSTYPDHELVERALTTAQQVVYVGPFANPTSERARLHLPLEMHVHRDGTAVNLEWRVQAREKAVLLTTGNSVLEILNALNAEMDREAIAGNEFGLNALLRAALSAYPREELSTFHRHGVLMQTGEVGAAAPAAAVELPAEIKGNADWPLVVIPKRFLYNDREEIRYSPVFDRVPKPFSAFVNPTDAKVKNLNNGDFVELQNGDGSALLPIQLASWVRQGSVVINDLCLAAPANALVGREPVRVALQRASAPKPEPQAHEGGTETPIGQTAGVQPGPHGSSSGHGGPAFQPDAPSSSEAAE